MPTVTRQKPSPPAAHRSTPNRSGSGDVLSRIRPIEKPERGIRACFYGRSGSGKTTLLATFPKPILFIRPPDDDGRQSIHNVDGIMDVDLQTIEEIAKLAEHARTSGKYRTIGLDNASALQELALARVLGVERVPAQLSWGSATQQQWGEVGSLMKEALRDILRQPNANAVILAQEREFDNDGNSSELLTPSVNTALSPSVTGWLGPTVDYLAQTFVRMGVKEVKKKVAGKDLTVKVDVPEYCLRTGPHPVYATKFRVPRGSPLPEVIVDPTYDKILALIEGRNGA